MAAKRRAPRVVAPTVRRLEGVSVAAAWGAPELLAPFSDRPASKRGGVPEAEVWYGAHARYPSPVGEGDARTSAADLDPAEQPPLIVKLLAASAPLSIQVHPDDATAQHGFAAEESAGLPSAAPERHFVDPLGKTELIRALGPMRVLCGLRPAAASRALLSMLAPEGADALIELFAHGDAGLGDAVVRILRADELTTALHLAAVRDGASDILARADAEGGAPVDEGLVRLARLAMDLQSRHPEDPATLVALLLEDVDLAPGEAIAVAPGTPHAYLAGLGVEVMTPSDNVVRAGMTVKHVDVDAFLAILDFGAVGVPRVGSLPRRADGRGWRRFITPMDAFIVDEADVDGALLVEREGSAPGIVLCVAGSVVLRAEDGSAAELQAGGAALLSAGIAPVEVRGQGAVLHASRIRRVEAAPTSG